MRESKEDILDKQLLDKIMRQSANLRYMGNEYNMVEKNRSEVLIILPSLFRMYMKWACPIWG